MEKDKSAAKSAGNLRGNLYLLTGTIAVVYSLLIAGSFVWILYHEHREQIGLAKREALATFNKDLSFRTWATGHGGVYVPVTAETPPNPYLKQIPERDIVTPSGRRLTLMNPAYLMRQAMQQYSEQHGVTGHLTSLNALNPANAPDPWERQALNRLELGEQEVAEIAELDNKPYLRLMKPMITRQGCLKCHAAQGYREGDIRGGLGISVPLAPYLAIEKKSRRDQAVSHLLIWLLGMTGIGFGVFKGKAGITGWQRAEQSLKLSEERLRNAQRQARIGSWELDLVTNNLIWSDEIYRIFEINPEQFGASYEAFLELIHPDDHASVNAAYTDSVKSRIPYVIGHRLRFPDGRIKNVIEQCETFYAADGRPLRSIGTVQDITELKRAEEALQRLNRELRAISSCNQVLVRAADEKTLLNDICRIVCDEADYRMAWVGYAESNADKTILPVARAGAEDGYLADIDITWDDTDRGRGPSGTAIRSGNTSCIQDFVTEAEAAPWRDRAVQHGYRSSITLPLKDESSHAFGVLNIYSAEPDSFSPDEIRLLEELSGDLAFGIMVLRRRVEQKRAEAELFKSEASLRTLIQTIPDLIWLKNAAGVYLACNPMFERFFGAKEADIIGKTDYDFVDRELADFFREHDRKAMAAGKPSSNEEWITFADDGHRALLDTTKTPMLDADGKVIGVLGIGHDITERRSLENQLRQSQKLEAIGTLTGGIAHDFNNILTVIMGFGSMLEMKMSTDDPLHDNVKQILIAADRAANLTRSMLAFSRKQVMEVKPENMNEIISGMEKMLRRLIREDIELRLRLTEEALPVLADAGQLEQVLLNLTTNAKDSMPAGGIITITTEQVEVDDSFKKAHGYGEPGSYAFISFIDSGEGMDADVRQRIFEPFFTTKEVGKGTGLGLAVCYGIIKQHHGYIVCDSEPGKGTTFRVYLPLNRVEAVAESAAAVESSPLRGGTETILVAEDDAAVRSLTINILKEFGYAIIEAEDGAEAVAQFVEHSEEIQLCLFDLIMPKKNGMNAYEEIKKVRPDIRVLFMSGYQADATFEGVHLISKPVLPRELLKRVRELLDR